MCVSFKNRWVNCTTDRSVSTDAVSGTSDVTGDTFSKLESQFVNAISENKLSIAETRYLFNCILNRFEKDMPVTNHSK